MIIARRNGDTVLEPVNDHLYALEVVATKPDELPNEVRFKLGGREHCLGVPGADDEVLHLSTPSI